MRRRPYNRFLDEGMTAWIARTAEKNYWRVASWYGLDDLIQDGFLAYVICKNRYGQQVERRAHFMALFKRVYLNMIHDMAKQRSKRPEEVAIADVFDEEHSEYLSEASLALVEPDAELFATLSNAPPHIKQLLALLNDPDAPAHLRRRSGDVKRRETNEQYYKRVLGIAGVDLEADFKALLGA